MHVKECNTQPRANFTSCWRPVPAASPACLPAQAVGSLTAARCPSCVCNRPCDPWSSAGAVPCPLSQAHAKKMWAVPSLRRNTGPLMLFFMFVSWWGMDGVEGPSGGVAVHCRAKSTEGCCFSVFPFFCSTLTALLWEFALLFHR